MQGVDPVGGGWQQWKIKIESNSSEETVWFADWTIGLISPISVWPLFGSIDQTGPEPWLVGPADLIRFLKP